MSEVAPQPQMSKGLMITLGVVAIGGVLFLLVGRPLLFGEDPEPEQSLPSLPSAEPGTAAPAPLPEVAAPNDADFQVFAGARDPFQQLVAEGAPAGAGAAPGTTTLPGGTTTTSPAAQGSAASTTTTTPGSGTTAGGMIDAANTASQSGATSSGTSATQATPPAVPSLPGATSTTPSGTTPSGTDATTGSGTTSGATTGSATTSGATTDTNGTSTATTRPRDEATVQANTVRLVETYVGTDRLPRAVITVNGNGYDDLKETATFAEGYRVLDIDGRCATISSPNGRFVLCQGERIQK